LNAQWAEAATFVPPRRGSVAQAIADHVRRRIVTGDLAVGRQLPSIANMATLFGVSVPTMQAAVHVLASIGLVRVSHGVGTFVTRPRDGAALLNHAWLQASTAELAFMRAAIDRHMPVVVAQLARTKPTNRLPTTLSDISLWAYERSAARYGFPEHFLRSDLRFHLEIARSVRGAEVTSDLCRRIGERLLPRLMGVADVQAADDDLDEMHRGLAASILDGQAITAARLAGCVTRREMRSLNESLG
jgi:DNA-binding FadR family transcriptional regulator